jgi:hypothetical protein
MADDDDIERLHDLVDINVHPGAMLRLGQG